MNRISSILLSVSHIAYLAEKVHVHRWPQDSPVWDGSTTHLIDEFINKNPENKRIVIKDALLQIEDLKFHSLCKIGVSVPFFKDECTMILESQFGSSLCAHIHITTRSEDYIDIFNQLTAWKKKMPSLY